MNLPARLIFGVALSCVSLIALTGCGSTIAKFEPSGSSYESKFFAVSDAATEMRVKGATVTSNYFDGGQQALLGRTFNKTEYTIEGKRVVAINKDFWVKHFKSDPAVIGKSLAIDGSDYTIVGVLPDSYNVPAGAEIWVPKS
jgi:putative ABC transport system permease protein